MWDLLLQTVCSGLRKRAEPEVNLENRLQLSFELAHKGGSTAEVTEQGLGSRAELSLELNSSALLAV